LKTQKHIFFLLLILITSRLAAQQSNFDFVENKGQWNSQVKFKGDVGTGSFFLQKTGLQFLMMMTILITAAIAFKTTYHRFERQ